MNGWLELSMKFFQYIESEFYTFIISIGILYIIIYTIYKYM